MPESLNLSNLKPAQERTDRKRVGRGLGHGAREGRVGRRHADAAARAQAAQAEEPEAPPGGPDEARRGSRIGAGDGRGLMLSWLANAWRVPELRRRLLFTAAVLAAY